MKNGQPDPQSKASKISALETLEAQVYPIEVTEDLDDVGSVTARRAQIVQGSLQRVPEEERENGVEIWRVLVQEVALA